MKPVPFDYRAPVSLEEALPLLGDRKRRARRRPEPRSPAQPAPRSAGACGRHQRVAELDYIRADDGSLRIGALTRQVALERSELVERRWPLLHKAVGFVGPSPDPQRVGRWAARWRTPTRPRSCRWRSPRLARASTCARRAALARWRRPSSSSVRSTRPASPTSCSSRSRCRSSPRAQAAASRSTRAPTATSRRQVPRPWWLQAACRHRAARRGARARCAPRRPSARWRAAPRRPRPQRWPPQDVEDEHRRALCTELARRAIEEALG